MRTEAPSHNLVPTGKQRSKRGLPASRGPTGPHIDPRHAARRRVAQAAGILRSSPQSLLAADRRRCRRANARRLRRSPSTAQTQRLRALGRAFERGADWQPRFSHQERASEPICGALPRLSRYLDDRFQWPEGACAFSPARRSRQKNRQAQSPLARAALDEPDLCSAV